MRPAQQPKILERCPPAERERVLVMQLEPPAA
jgi:hypothetical protein